MQKEAQCCNAAFYKNLKVLTSDKEKPQKIPPRLYNPLTLSSASVVKSHIDQSTCINISSSMTKQDHGGIQGSVAQMHRGPKRGLSDFLLLREVYCSILLLLLLFKELPILLKPMFWRCACIIQFQCRLFWRVPILLKLYHMSVLIWCLLCLLMQIRAGLYCKL